MTEVCNVDFSRVSSFYEITKQMMLELGKRRALIIDAINAQLRPNDSYSSNDNEIKKSLFENFNDIDFHYHVYIFTSEEIKKIYDKQNYKFKLPKKYRNMNTAITPPDKDYNPLTNEYAIDKNNLNIDEINAEIQSELLEQDIDDMLQLMYENYTENERPFEETNNLFNLDIKNEIMELFYRYLQLRDQLRTACKNS
jgi:hypothetical protein